MIFFIKRGEWTHRVEFLLWIVCTFDSVKASGLANPYQINERCLFLKLLSYYEVKISP